MTDKKKTWTEPELIVIVRGKPEEAVLGVCKVTAESVNPVDYNSGCIEEPCTVCSGSSGS